MPDAGYWILDTSRANLTAFSYNVFPYCCHSVASFWTLLSYVYDTFKTQSNIIQPGYPNIIIYTNHRYLSDE